MSYEQRLSNLSVGYHPTKSFVKTPDIKLIDSLSKKLIEKYTKLPIGLMLDKDIIKSLCLSSVKYILWIIGDLANDKSIRKNFSLWLSLIYLVSNIFGIYQRKIGEAYKLQILKTFKTIYQSNLHVYQMSESVSYSKDELFKDESPKSGSLFHALIETIEIVLSKYFKKFKRYTKSKVFVQIEHWLIIYLETLPVLGDSPRIKLLSDYEKWRLGNTPIMCLIWHLILFHQISDITSKDYIFFEKVSVVISYHNDILSYHIDRKNGTLNLIDTLSPDKAKIEAFRNAIDLVNMYYKGLISLNRGVSNETSSIILDILEGTYSWSQNEERYTPGLKLIEAVKKNNDVLFNRLLDNI